MARVILHEHEHLPEDVSALLTNLKNECILEGQLPPYLGMTPEGCGYYVGAVWLEETAIIVLPKFPDIDFVSILGEALKNGIPAEYFESSYNVSLNKPLIQAETLATVLSPLLVAHYLSILAGLLSHGLKRNYVQSEGNLTCKVRGHILPAQNLLKNIWCGHEERSMCSFQEYTADYPENRLLKCALLACQSLIREFGNSALMQAVRKLLGCFEGINASVTLSEVKAIHGNRLHREYPQAIRLAKLVLQRTGFSIGEQPAQNGMVPEFSIDMSRIFEFHVFSLLLEKFGKDRVLFQEPADPMGRCDYLVPDKKLIADAKYKINYGNPNPLLNTRLQNDIRQIAGYGRSTGILKKLELSDTTPCCWLIYPAQEAPPTFPEKEPVPIEGVKDFFMHSVSLPRLGDQLSSQS